MKVNVFRGRKNVAAQSDPQNDFDTLKGLGAPARRALAGAGYTRFEQLAEVTEAEIAALHGIGKNALSVLRQQLAERGLSFRQ